MKKVAIVTGAAQGMGYGLAINFLKKGYKVVFCDLNVEFLKLNDRISNENQSIVNKTLVDKYKKLQNQDPKAPYKNKFKYTGDLSEKGDHEVCVICFNELKLDQLMVMCPECRNIIHIDCMKKWLNMGKTTCVYCRSSIWNQYNKEEKKEKYNKNNKYKSLENI